MSHLLRRFLALGAFFAFCAVLLTACGGVPGNAVATVGGTSITKSTFDHWLTVAAKSNAQSSPGTPAVVPDPPKYMSCVAQLRKATPPPQGGQPAVTDVQLKSQCQAQYSMSRDEVMQLLISDQWLRGEAKDLGIKVTDAQVQQQFLKTKQQAFPKEADFQKFLAQSGMTMPDIMLRVRDDVLKTRITAKVTKGSTTVTQAQIAQYYTAHKSQYYQPERRDLQVVLTKTQDDANKAKKELQGGKSFADVAKQLSVDPQSKNNGGLLQNVVKGQQDQALDQAAFSASQGKLQGPVKGQFGYYVFSVKSITPAKQQTLADVSSSIRQSLISQRQQTAITAFAKKFQSKWKSRTECRKGFVVQLCKGYKAPKTPPGGAPGGVPGQAPPGSGAPQQAPPGSGAPQQVPPGSGAPQQVPPGGGAPQQVPPGGGAPQQVPPGSGGGAPQQVPPGSGGGAAPPGSSPGG